MSQPKPRPRGRMALAWAVVLFVALQLVVSVVFDYRWFRWRYPGYQRLVTRLDAQQPSPQVLFFGSSRTGGNILEREVNAVLRDLTGDGQACCFNAAMGWGEATVHERLLRDLLQRGVRPRFLVIECVPEGVHERSRWLTGYTPWLLCWHDLPDFAWELTLSGNLKRFAGSHLLPTYVYRDPLRHHLRAHLKEWYDGPAAPAPPANASGQPPRDAAAWREVIAAGLRAAHQGQPPQLSPPPDALARDMERYKAGGNLAARLERLLDTCREHHIEVIFVGVPLSAIYRRAYTPQSEAGFRAYMDELAERYGCHYVDYRASLPDTCFYDYHHTTYAGAEIYSRTIALEVLAPLWQTQIQRVR